MISYFRYIPYHSLLASLAEGWKPVADLGSVHGQWSVLCRWEGPDLSL